MSGRLMIWMAVALLLAIPGASGATPAPAPAPQPAAPLLYDFKGVPLEISLEDFRRLPHPDPDIADRDAARVVCTGERVATTPGFPAQEPSNVMLFDPVEEALGVKKCVWIDTSANPPNPMGGSVEALGFASSGYGTYDYSFKFMPDPKDGVMRFYEFEGSSNRNATDDVIKALTAKFGDPTITISKVQNQLGASFDQVTAVWANPAASITVQDRWTKVDDMVIIVDDSRLEEIYTKAKAAKNASTPNGI
jgi:hypothetical protein